MSWICLSDSYGIKNGDIDWHTLALDSFGSEIEAALID